MASDPEDANVFNIRHDTESAAVEWVAQWVWWHF